MRAYLNGLQKAEEALEADLPRYLHLWEKCVPPEFKDVHQWDFSKFTRGERFVFKPMPRSEFDEVMVQVNRWGLDDHLDAFLTPGLKILNVHPFPFAANVTSEGPVFQVESSAAGARIGAVGIPDLDKDGIPIPGSSVATEDGLIIIEVGKSTASASVDKLSAASSSDATAALVTVKVRDITQTKPTYQEISVARASVYGIAAR